MSDDNCLMLSKSNYYIIKLSKSKAILTMFYKKLENFTHKTANYGGNEVCNYCNWYCVSKFCNVCF